MLYAKKHAQAEQLHSQTKTLCAKSAYAYFAIIYGQAWIFLLQLFKKTVSIIFLIILYSPYFCYSIF